MLEQARLDPNVAGTVRTGILALNDCPAPSSRWGTLLKRGRGLLSLKRSGFAAKAEAVTGRATGYVDSSASSADKVFKAI